MADTPDTSPDTSSEKPKKKVITVGVDRLANKDRPNKERRGGKGRRGGRDRDEDRKPAVPPALMRGPRPQPKAAEPEQPDATEAESEATTEDTAAAEDTATEDSSAE